MNLVITTYLDRDPEAVLVNADRAIPSAVAAAAERIGLEAAPAAAVPTGTGFVVRGGLDVLDGAEIDLDGAHRLTRVTVTVPWSLDDARSGAKLLAANRFARVLSTEVRALSTEIPAAA